MVDTTCLSTHMEFNHLQRVKVYRLNDEGRWDDKGTGHVSVEYLERSGAVGLVVIDEEDNQTILVHRISSDDIYRRQEDTIISWTDPEVATDLALSFQEAMGCTFIWDQICHVQRTMHFPSVAGLDGAGRPGGDDLEQSGSSQDHGGSTEALELPLVELSTLPQIAKAIGEVLPYDKDRVATMVVRDHNYIRKLVELFRTCEDLENDEGLQLLFKIVKGIISLNDGHIFDIIFSDEYIMDIVGALEYDPKLAKRQSHRTYLQQQAIFKEAVPIHDPAILSKIHQTYRIGYIKDIILPSVLDDSTFSTINSIMLFNNISVVSALQNDSAFLSELFSQLRSPETPLKCKQDLVFFVQEFCNLSKHLQTGVRSQFFSALVKEGLFDVVKDILKDVEESVRLSGCDILIVIFNSDPTLLRSFLVHQTSHSLFSELVSGMLTQSKCGLQAQLLEIMRMLLDSETMDAVDRSPFLEIFYEKYMDQIVGVISCGCPSEPDFVNEVENQVRPYVSPEILVNICELLCLCVQHHRFRIKNYVMRKHLVEKVLRLTRRKEKYLVVAAVHFLRTCISLKEEFYYRYILKNNCFEPIIATFVANGNRYNLLNSVVLELIDFIRKEGIKCLIVHLVETYASKLEVIDYVDTFQALKLKYDQILEASPGFPGGTMIGGGPDHGSRSTRNGLGYVGLPESRKRSDDRALDKDEEEYFNEESDDEKDSAQAKLRASLGSKLANVGLLDKSRDLGRAPFSDEEKDTATARLRTSTGQHATRGVLLHNKPIVLNNLPYRGNMFGLVDYEGEEDMTMNLGSNGKDGGEVLSNSLLTDPILPNLEDVTIESPKRKSISASELQQNEAVAPKRQKPGKGEATEHSSTQTGIDGSVGCAPSVTDAEVLKSAELMKPDSEVSTFPGIPAPRSDSVKIFPSESTQLLGNGLTTFDPDSYLSTELNHVTGGDSLSSARADTTEIVPCSNGKVNVSGQSANCLKMLADVVGKTVKGPANSSIKRTTECEVLKSPGLREDQSMQNGASSGESRVKPSGMVRNTQAEKCTEGNGAVDLLKQQRNGNATETSAIKGNSVSSGVTRELNGGSLECEVKKLTGLGSDLTTTVTPTPPGLYTVR